MLNTGVDTIVDTEVGTIVNTEVGAIMDTEVGTIVNTEATVFWSETRCKLVDRHQARRHYANKAGLRSNVCHIWKIPGSNLGLNMSRPD
jgi:hypothetical protein